MNAKHQFAVYYGTRAVQDLARYQLVALQPGHYSTGDLQVLHARGTRALAYLSVAEDPHDHPEWQLGFNAQWNTHHVDVRSSRWQQHVLQQARAAIRQGFDGLLLDTLDTVELYPQTKRAALQLLRALRREFPTAYLLGNRGFCLYPDATPYLDGALLESFSTTWLDGYRRLTPMELEFTEAMMHQARQYGLDVYALDYAITPALRDFALRRANRLGIPVFVSNRMLDVLPTPDSSTTSLTRRTVGTHER